MCHPNMPRLRGSSPWGGIDHLTYFGPNACSVSTPSHGGFWVAPELNKLIPSQLRNGAGWYEEDCDWALPMTFCQLWREAETEARGDEMREAALTTLRNWHPDAYEAFTGRQLCPGESFKRDEEAWRRDNAERIQVLSAFGDWAAWVPAGKVGVVACVGGRTDHGGYAGPERFFLIPADEYRARPTVGSFIVDPERHCEICEPPNMHERKVAA